MTDKEKIEKLSRALRVMIEDNGDTPEEYLEFMRDSEMLNLFNEKVRTKISVVAEGVRVILQDEKEPPKIKMELGLVVGAKRAAYEASRAYGRCLRGKIANIDHVTKVALIFGKWEGAIGENLPLWVHEEDLCEPEDI